MELGVEERVAREAREAHPQQLAERLARVLRPVKLAVEDLVVDEMYVGPLRVGDSVRARGVGPSGHKEWFVGTVVEIRRAWPPLKIKYVATEGGQTNALLLPQPKIAFLWAAEVTQL